MSKLIKRDLGKGAGYFYSAFRIIVGLMFFQHGLQKVFGFFGGVDGLGHPVNQMFSLIGWAGLIELAVGLFLALGVFSRLAAILGVIEMTVAYCMVHFPQGFFPLKNGGELALMYLASFLAIISKGSSKWSIEKAILGREIF